MGPSPQQEHVELGALLLGQGRRLDDETGDPRVPPSGVQLEPRGGEGIGVAWAMALERVDLGAHIATVASTSAQRAAVIRCSAPGWSCRMVSSASRRSATDEVEEMVSMSVPWAEKNRRATSPAYPPIQTDGERSKFTLSVRQQRNV